MMIKRTSSTLLCWTLLASIVCGQSSTYSSPFASNQPGFVSPGQPRNLSQTAAALPPGYGGYDGFQSGQTRSISTATPAARSPGLRAYNISSSATQSGLSAAPHAASPHSGNASGNSSHYNQPPFTQSLHPEQQYSAAPAPVPDYGVNSGSVHQSAPPYYQSDPMPSYVPQQAYPVNSCDPLLDAGYFQGHQPCRRGLGIEAGPVFFRRDSSDNRTLFFSPTVAAQRINNSELDTGVAQGIEAAITLYDLSPTLDLELRATVLEEWTGQTSQVFTGPAIRYASNPVIDLVGPRNAAASLTSEFFSAELNARYRADTVCTGMTLLMGIRLLTLEEQLGATFADPLNVLPAELAQSQVRNRLFGLQLGADQVLMHNTNWFIKFVSRIGVYGNDVDQQTQLIRQTAPPTIQQAGGNDGEIALHGEFGIMGKIRLAPWVNVVAGYRAIYMDGVALASEQLATSNLVTGSGLNSNSSLLLHGANVGLELAF